MRRCRNRVCKMVKWRLDLAAPPAVLTYIIMFAIIFTNFIAVFVFTATRSQVLQDNISVLLGRDLRLKDQGLSTIQSLNEQIENAAGEGLEDMISINVLLKLLEQFRDDEGEIRQSYIDAVLHHNNLIIDKRWFLCGRTLKTAQNFTNLLHKSGSSKLNSYSARSTFSLLESSNGLQTSRADENNYNRPTSVHSIRTLNNSSIKSGLTQEQHRSTLSSSAKKQVNAEINSSLGPVRNVQMENTISHNLKNSRTISCINYTTDLVFKVVPVMQEKTPKELAVMFPMLQEGGHYTPKKCLSKENTAIIIPYRNRYSHLHILLLNILPLLIKQNVEFTIFVVEQELPGTFNRGMLFNVGFLEALKLDKFDCFIFHDVDLIPINEYNFYHCNDQPTHYVAGVNKFKYKLMYNNMFGGVVAFTQKQFRDVNGASNLYFGWGGEDDDLRRRVVQNGYTITRTDSSIGLYDMIIHKRDETNNINPVRRQMLKLAKNSEGLNTTIYTRNSVEILPLYTWIKVNINMTEVLQTAPKEMSQIRDKLLNHFSLDQKSTKHD